MFENPHIFAEKDDFDLLRYKVKEDHFKKNGFKPKFVTVTLMGVKEGEYELKMAFDAVNLKSEEHSENYVVFSLYPKDEDLEMLHSERQKYGFESYTVKIKRNKEGILTASRQIKTKLKHARAITIAIVSYKNKEKSMEVVLRDINLLHKKHGNEL